jgi:hypothetical protein
MTSFFTDNTESYFFDDPTATTVYDVVPGMSIPLFYRLGYRQSFAESMLDIIGITLTVFYITFIIMFLRLFFFYS